MAVNIYFGSCSDEDLKKYPPEEHSEECLLYIPGRKYNSNMFECWIPLQFESVDKPITTKGYEKFKQKEICGLLVSKIFIDNFTHLENIKIVNGKKYIGFEYREFYTSCGIMRLHELGDDGVNTEFKPYPFNEMSNGWISSNEKIQEGGVKI